MVGVFFACLAVVLRERPLNSVQAIASFSLMGLIAVLILPIAGLFSFHIVLISNGRTTNEHVTGKYRGQNFFSRGFLVNFIYLFCGSLTPQLKPVRIDRERLKMRKSESKGSEGALGKEDSDKMASNATAIGSGGGGSSGKKASVDKTGAVLNNRASGAVVLVNADEGQHLKSSYSQNSLTNKKENGRLQEQDLLELVLKNKRAKAALKSQSRPTSSSSSSPNESFRSNSILDDANPTTPRAQTTPHARQ